MMKVINNVSDYTATKAQAAGEAFAQGLANGVAKICIFTIKTTFNATSSLASHTIQIMLPTRYLEVYLTPEDLKKVKDGIHKITPWLIKGALFVATGTTPIGIACKAFVITHTILDNEYAAGIIGRVLKAVLGGGVAKAEKAAPTTPVDIKVDALGEMLEAINNKSSYVRIGSTNIANPTAYDAAKKLYTPKKDVYIYVPKNTLGELDYLNEYATDSVSQATIAFEKKAKVDPYAAFRKASNEMQKKQKKAEPKAEESVKTSTSQPVKTETSVAFLSRANLDIKPMIKVPGEINFSKQTFVQKGESTNLPFVKNDNKSKPVLSGSPKGFKQSPAKVATLIKTLKLFR